MSHGALSRQVVRSVTGVAICLVLAVSAGWAGTFRFGVNADNWKGEMGRPGFAKIVKQLGVEFVVWHLSPEEEASERMMEIVHFCRTNNIAYLFNTGLINYVPNVSSFTNSDGTYRWDLRQETLDKLTDAPLFLGQVYGEAMLMQSLNGVTVGNRRIPPYFVDTASLLPDQAFTAVVDKISERSARYVRYGKHAVFEMVFPDYAHATARGGTTLAPKLLKETANDLMFAVSAGAARQYGQKELWACADLWFWDKFPEKGKAGPGYHTPDQLYARGAHIFRRPPIFFSRAFLPCSWWIKPSRGSATFPRLGSWIRHVRRKIRLAMVRAISLCPWHGMNDCRQRRNPARTAPKILAKNGC
jgi:hypothetical protein